MVDETDVSLTTNGNGAQAYFNTNLLGDTACPLDPGDRCRAIAVQYGILLVPETDERSFTIEVVTTDDQ
ncbi:hypothetical protein [Natronocalculus amylovorans]|uniref:Uncharacterized protein n=1 Tax=Natronocalculus amylovorans TaxID=2917812 RepID=A0AAE3FZS2_9EURY|nr:hypothetical protein [Natronocalculus amylovorans]MCL9818334.1 hypothetical protein [Natronocalculus amylovorans]